MIPFTVQALFLVNVVLACKTMPTASTARRMNVITTREYLRDVSAGKDVYPIKIPLPRYLRDPPVGNRKKHPMWVHVLPSPHNVTGRQDEEGIEEYYSKVLDSKSDLAFICPYERLEEFHNLFPQLKVKHYESADDFWSGRSFQCQYRPRKSYETIVDLSTDEHLWNHSKQIVGKGGKATITIDCIIFAEVCSNEAWVTRGLASCMWSGGTRRKRPILHNPKVLISSIGFDSFGFPISEAGPAPSLMMKHGRGVAPTFEYLKRTCDGCGWFTGDPEIYFLVTNREGDKQRKKKLVDAGTEHLHVLPVDEDQVIEWIDNGMVASKEVVLHDTKGNKYARFQSHIPKIQIEWFKDSEPQLYATGAKIIVFYCNHAHTSSPAYAKGYLEWVRANHPKSRQQVKVLHHGMCGLQDRVWELRRKDILKGVHQ